MKNDWPSRPEGERFPELLDTVLVGQLLPYDRRGTVDQGRRHVRMLVKDAGLPTLGRIGSAIMYRKADVIAWLESRGVDTASTDGTVVEPRMLGPTEWIPEKNPA